MKIDILHNEAMAKADLAFLSNRNGDAEVAIMYYREGLDLEKKAYDELVKNNIGEPSRSILLMSAANLAINAKKLTEAEELIYLALKGEPPAAIAEELTELLESINIEKNTGEKPDLSLEPEVQLPISTIDDNNAENEENITKPGYSNRHLNEEKISSVYVGILIAAKKSQNSIWLKTKDRELKIIIHSGIDEVVRTYWDKEVAIKAYKKSNSFHLIEIVP